MADKRRFSKFMSKVMKENKLEHNFKSLESYRKLQLGEDEQVRATQEWLNDTYGSYYTQAGYGLLDVTGYTSWDTIYALIMGLQVELGIETISPNFGPTTISYMDNYGSISQGNNDSNKNINHIIHGGCWCTGYSPGYEDQEIFDADLTSAIKQLQTNIGISADGIVDTKTMKALLTLNAYVLVGEGTENVREFQQWLNKTYGGHADFYYYPCDGNYSRQTQEAICYGLQFEMNIDGANGWFGPGTMAGLERLNTITVGTTDPMSVPSDFDSNNHFVRLFTGSFICNRPNLGLYSSVSYAENMSVAVADFQNFSHLNVNGNGDYDTWCELLISTGNPDRETTGLDYSTKFSNGTRTSSGITDAYAKSAYDNGYRQVGRYLTNQCGLDDESQCIDKVLYQNELDILLDNKLSIFPLYETWGYMSDYYSAEQGIEDANDSYNIARNQFGIPKGTTIYFAVDYDAYDYEVIDIATGVLGPIGEYFKALKSNLKDYHIGIYGSRNICDLIVRYTLNGAGKSFICAMSSGFSGNLGYTMPQSWSFNQIREDLDAEVDYDVVRGTDLGFSYTSKGDGDNFSLFQEQIQEIYNLALIETSNNISDANNLTAQYYRYKGEYIGLKYDKVFGTLPQEFCQEIDETLGSHVITTFEDPGSKINLDLPHMFASVCGFIKYGFDHTVLNFADFGAWAGDFVTQMGDYTNARKNGLNLSPAEYINDYCGTNNRDLNGANTYDKIDYYADMDSVVTYAFTYVNRDDVADKTILYSLNRLYNGDLNSQRFKYEFHNRYQDSTAQEQAITRDLVYLNGIGTELEGYITTLYLEQTQGGKFYGDFNDGERDEFINSYTLRKQEYRDSENV